MLFYNVSYYTIYSILVYYTLVVPGDRLASPGGRPAPKVQRGLEGSHAPQRESGGSAPRVA